MLNMLLKTFFRAASSPAWTFQKKSAVTSPLWRSMTKVQSFIHCLLILSSWPEGTEDFGTFWTESVEIFHIYFISIQNRHFSPFFSSSSFFYISSREGASIIWLQVPLGMVSLVLIQSHLTKPQLTWPLQSLKQTYVDHWVFREKLCLKDILLW